MSKVILEGTLDYWFDNKDKLAIYKNANTKDVTVCDVFVTLMGKAHEQGMLYKNVRITMEEI